MESQGWPNHPTATFPNSGNPNTIRVQEFSFRGAIEDNAQGESRLEAVIAEVRPGSVAREGNTVTASIDVPADASLGMLLDCHLEFEAGGRTRAVKKNAVLRIVE